ncbi:sensory transduction protein [Enterovibrio norvegicus]|uniref:bifunctional diguanylate cyclase/phosphodiesterase n=1 Tax=Enterovibrio norvegicus TaxID=188144 RepID=UPI0002F28248|nr:EAL domain-containing protein [Enterovibrio norvegicus]OEF59720.1 sensory transduction protein [Enterovibrio norvegicus]
MSAFKINIIDTPSTPSCRPETEKTWKIAVIDDEESMHQATTLALRNISVMGYPLSFLHAYSGEEGKALLQQHPDTAVVLLDVVMEKEDAGLVLANIIRNELNNKTTQIVLRTGQPGYAPEEAIIERFEINDYKTKNELTRNKLFSTICTAIRSYKNLISIEKSRDGLRKIIESSADQFQERSLARFSEGVLEQINVLFDIHSEGIFCVSTRPMNPPKELAKIYYQSKSEENESIVVAASQKYLNAFGKKLEQLPLDDASLSVIHQSLKESRNIIRGNDVALYLSTPSQWKAVIYIHSDKEDAINNIDPELLSVFIQNASLGLENTKYISQLLDAAFVDEVTGLASRLGFVDNYAPSLLEKEGALTLSVVDIDDFHQITESLGFDFGSKVLRAFANVLKQSLPSNSVIARLHSDSFAIATPIDEPALLDTLQSIQETTLSLQEVGSIRLGVSAGLHKIVLNEDDNCIEKALCRAEMALKQAKIQRRGETLTFDSLMEKNCNERLLIINKLRQDLTDEKLYMMFQPKVCIHDGSIIGAEALVRWHHQELGHVSPAVFVPIAEAAGLSFELDMFVFRSVCQIMAENPEFPEIAVNISPLSFNRRELIPFLNQMLATYQIDKKRISLEITEGCMVQGEGSRKKMAELHTQQWCLHLDDFGSGYSSFGYLLELPVSVIKIDRIFTWELSKCERADRLLGGMVNMLSGMGKKVLIEGLETEEQVNAAREAGLDMAQGYFFYKPLLIGDLMSAFNEKKYHHTQPVINHASVSQSN